METNYIQFPKELRDELALAYKFRNQYFELKKEYDKLFTGCYYGHISLNAINREIGEKLQYAKTLTDKNPEIKRFLEFKVKYLDLYEEVRNAFLKYHNKIPDNAKQNTSNLEYQNDILSNLLDAWIRNCGFKILDTLGIEYKKNEEV
jgi:hypothetical protein